MATIDVELDEAQKALEALNALSLSTMDAAIGILRRASNAATIPMTPALSSEAADAAALDRARAEVANQISALIPAIEQRSVPPDKIGSARRAIQNWIRELQALRL